MKVLIPGLRNSKPNHWQSLWEQAYPNQFIRVHQANWEQPDAAIWIAEMEKQLAQFDASELILIGHSIGCMAIVKWFQTYGHRIKGALLVAPSDAEQPNYPEYITGFSPIPLEPLPFPTIVVASSNDHVTAVDRASHFAQQWGSRLVVLPNAGHIEPKSGFGAWPLGLELIATLEDQTT
jgi:predicted alpha/beta hydrolase family esterase